MAVVRPISPFLAIYRLQIGSFFSIFSRISGLILLVFLTFTILSFALSSTFLLYYPFFFFFYILLKSAYTNYLFNFLFTFLFVALTYHLVSGLRYLVWSYHDGLSFKFMNFFIFGSIQKSLKILGLTSLILVPFLLILF